MKPGPMRTMMISLTLFFIAATLAVIAYIWRLTAEIGDAGVEARLIELTPWFQLWRLTLIAAVVGCWPLWIGWAAGKYAWNERQKALVAAYRWPMLRLFLLYELLVVPRGYLFELFF